MRSHTAIIEELANLTTAYENGSPMDKQTLLPSIEKRRAELAALYQQELEASEERKKARSKWWFIFWLNAEVYLFMAVVCGLGLLNVYIVWKLLFGS